MRESNDKGFSLVELVIVIAIMAVLVGILAPQYMKYVTKTEKTKDCSTISTILDACEVMALDPDTIWESGIDDAITITVGKTATTYSGNAADALEEYVSSSHAKLESGDWGPFTIVATRTENGRVNFEVVNEQKKSLNEYSQELAKRLE